LDRIRRRAKAVADRGAAAKQRISQEVREVNFRKQTLLTPKLPAKIKYGDMGVVRQLLTGFPIIFGWPLVGLNFVMSTKLGLA
jgi:hypothetical protein